MTEEDNIKPDVCRWKPPKDGNIVINVDAAVDEQGKCSSSVGIIRDHTDKVVHSFTSFMSHSVSLMIAELRAIKDGFLWARRLNMNHFTLCLDYLNDVNKVNLISSFGGDLEFLINDIRKAMITTKCRGVFFVPRTCIRVAHCLAKQALVVKAFYFWDGGYPPVAVSALELASVRYL
ncbi:hypothetical protein F8388_007604 [Cannabis sativa]|uniref:RNase H type-1 domain-containing protein n=1 Tax=Cannabis sativa TaxID=3483 RepID=A0A7J6ET71_CANSA|nr:hypothetical protein G4B88_027689 [Cannabis sativa]KAF4361588.1 hypothetical protein F8388_007604 [Cannabis sativa]